MDAKVVEDETARLTDVERGALRDIGNIAMGRAAESVTALINRRVEITPLSLPSRGGPPLFEFEGRLVGVQLSYTRGLHGKNVLVLPERAAAVIALLMAGGGGSNAPGTLREESELRAVSKAMNEMIGAFSTSMSEMLGRTIDITPPITFFPFKSDAVVTGDEGITVCVVFRLHIPGLIDSRMMQCTTFSLAEEPARRPVSFTSSVDNVSA